MSVLHGYLLRTILGTTILVLAVLASLGAFIEFVTQLDDVGVGDYQITDALLWVGLQLPWILVQLLPIATLLGALLGLGVLASRSELIVLQAAGISPAGIARSVLVTGVVIAVVGTLIGQYIAPPMERFARKHRDVAKFGQTGITAGGSAWIRDRSTILNVIPPGPENPGGGVFVFRLDPEGRLTATGRADSVTADADEQWFLNNFAESRFSAEGVTVLAGQKALALTGTNPDLLGLTVVREDTLTGPELWGYVQYLRASGLAARRYEVAFWSRLSASAAVPLMCILAVPFVLGPLRSSGAGGRLLVGVGIGLVWFLLSRLLADGGAIWNLSALVVAWVPTALLAAAAVVLFSRLR